MRAVTVVPGVAGSLRPEEVPETDAGSGSMVVEALAVGRRWRPSAVLENLVVLGSVNADRRHHHRAARTLAAADGGWLEQLIIPSGQPGPGADGAATGT